MIAEATRTRSTGAEPAGFARTGFTLGVAFVVAGGLVAAVTGPLALPRGSWVAAYLVLICGVMQCVLSAQATTLAPASAPRPSLLPVLVLWNIGNAAVVIGSLASAPYVTDAGGAVLLVTLVLALLRLRGAGRRGRAALLAALYVGIAPSVPIGLLLTHLRTAAGS